MADGTRMSDSVRGYCALCTAHCATVATTEGGKVVAVDADHDHPNGGVLCVKGKASPELVYHPDRLDFPLKRTTPKSAAPGWQRVSWNEALDDIAQRLLHTASAAEPARLRSPRAHGAVPRYRTPSAGWHAFSTVSAVPTGYPRPTSATGTRTQVSVTRSASKFRRPTWLAATRSCSGDTTRVRPR